MAIRIKRGLEANRAAITPLRGEPLFATDTKKLYVGDGITPGGVEVGLDGSITQTVQSVAGRTGAVVLSKSDVGLSNTQDTTDLLKPISNATQTALTAKADASALTAHTSNTLNPHGTTKAQLGLSSVDDISAISLRDRSTHTGTQSISTIAGLETSLNGKQPTGSYATTTALTDGLAAKQATLVSATNIKTINGTSILGVGDLVIAGGAGGATNLTSTPSPTTVTINSSTGTGAAIAATDATNAGLLLPAEKTKLTGIATGATANSSDATLLARANHTGTQLASTISDFSTTADARITAATGVSIASLTAGKIPTSQIPAVGLVTVQTAISQVAHLALTTQEGDVVVRTDENKSYMRNAGAAGTMADYTLLNTPTDVVTSVNSQIGAVVLGKTDVGLGNVDNTSDANKPVSTAQASADALKADDTVVVKLSGAQTVAGSKTLTNTLFTASLQPSADLTRDVGSSFFRYNNLYTQILNLNATASISGATAGVLAVVGSLAIAGATAGISSDATTGITRIFGGTANDGAGIVMGGSTNGTIPSIGLARIGSTDILKWNTAGVTLGSMAGLPTATHTLTLPSVATGISAYNTVDQTTNYERVREFWSGNTYYISGEIGGTGATRAIAITPFAGSTTLGLFMNASSLNGIVESRFTSATAGGIGFRTSGTYSASSGLQSGVSIAPTINQTATAGYTALLINPTETTVGTGAKNLIDAQVGGVSKFRVDNTGTPTIAPLAGTGTRMVTADASGVLSSQAIPAGGGTGITRSIATVTTTLTGGSTTSIDYMYLLGTGAVYTQPSAIGNTNLYTLKNKTATNMAISFTSLQTADGGALTLAPDETVTLFSDNANWQIGA